MNKPAESKLENALYVVATPIGNLQDITLRAISVLNFVDVILCEDTRIAAKLLNALDITKKKLVVYNDQSEEEDRHKILDLLLNDKSLALISDAGTPLISDPGFKLINFLRIRAQKIITIPGASSLTAALCASGLSCENFMFLGFLPPKNEAKSKMILALPSTITLVFFESANRLLKTLAILEKIMPSRTICVARELTKLHEEFVIDQARKLSEFFVKNPQKLCGEIVLIIEKSAKNDQKSAEFVEKNLADEILDMMQQGIGPRQISQELATTFAIGKKDIYRLAIELKSNPKLNLPD